MGSSDVNRFAVLAKEGSLSKKVIDMIRALVGLAGNAAV
jgi:hypothetical protein